MGLMMFSASAFAQEDKQDNTPGMGALSVGVNINCLGLGKSVSQPEDGAHVAEFVSATDALASRDMKFMTKDPLANIRVKYRMSNNMSLRLGVGFSGSSINYLEYVDDDLDHLKNPQSEKQIWDAVRAKNNTFSVNVGGEYQIGTGNMKFVMGYGLSYVIGGGKLTYDYGNQMTEANPTPTTIGMLRPNSDLNDYNPTSNNMDIAYARPTERYSIGHCQGIGATVDFGIEWFFVKKASLQANIGMTPVMYCFQPQTWSKFEGFSQKSQKVEQYTELISPGSHGIIYGTQNIGLNVGLNIYF